MVAGQRLPPARDCRPQLAHPDPLTQQPADLLIGDGRVGQIIPADVGKRPQPLS
jgi:hypothetical protein